jgi:hypothetical protein
MRDDPIIVGIVATIGTLALIALAVIAFLIIAPPPRGGAFPRPERRLRRLAGPGRGRIVHVPAIHAVTLLQWGIVAAMLTVVTGRLLAPKLADYAIAEAPVRRRMRRNAAVIIGIVVALAVLTSVSIWLWLAALSPDSCAWIAGIDGCLVK